MSEVLTDIMPVPAWAPADIQEIQVRRDAGEILTTAEFKSILMIHGRIHGPALLWDHWVEGVITDDTMAATIGGVWGAAEYPESSLDDFMWDEMFSLAGYRVDGVPAPPPKKIRLWRGAPEGWEYGMSWTSDRAVAERFASGDLLGRKPGKLWTVETGGGFVFAQLNGRSESEYVLCADTLYDIEEVG